VSPAAKPQPTTVEVVVDSVAGALAAAHGGAHRLELCCALAEGGLTPSIGLLQQVVRNCRLPVMAMLRPRGGDFLYDERELAVVLADAEALLAAGAHGLVFGALDADGNLDKTRMEAVVRAAAGRPVTCHRAFDVAADCGAVLEHLIALGVQRVLTSGQKASALAGADRIRALVAQSKGRIAVVAGGGLRADTVAAFVARTRVPEVHLSATLWQQSPMRHRNEEVAMGGKVPAGEYTRRATDAAAVAAVVAALRK
jgi:copper homeostasis protein